MQEYRQPDRTLTGSATISGKPDVREYIARSVNVFTFLAFLALLKKVFPIFVA